MQRLPLLKQLPNNKTKQKQKTKKGGWGMEGYQSDSKERKMKVSLAGSDYYFCHRFRSRPDVISAGVKNKLSIFFPFLLTRNDHAY